MQCAERTGLGAHKRGAEGAESILPLQRRHKCRVHKHGWVTQRGG